MSVPTMNEPPTLREERGRRYAQMGLVEWRSAELSFVTPPRPVGSEAVSFGVCRAEGGRLRCTCAEFEEMVVSDPDYRCDHIFAVQYSNVGDLGHGARGSANFDPAARTLADLVTIGQLSLIRQKAREAGVDPDVACKLWKGLDTGDLSKLGAMAFITHLESLKSESDGEAAEA